MGAIGTRLSLRPLRIQRVEADAKPGRIAPRECESVSLTPLVMPRAGGASSTSRSLGSSTEASGILDRPLQCASAHKADDDDGELFDN
jgi:hypothetical protein